MKRVFGNIAKIVLIKVEHDKRILSQKFFFMLSTQLILPTLILSITKEPMTLQRKVIL